MNCCLAACVRLPTWLFACACLVLVSLSGARADERRDSAEMMQLLAPVAEQVKSSVVQVFSGGRPVALGTVVADDGYVLTKGSELGGEPIRVRLWDRRLYPAQVASVRRNNDLVLLRIEADVNLPALEFDAIAPPVASFLISAGWNGRPIGLGVVGSPSRQIPHKGRLGVMLDNDASGRAFVQGVFPGSGAEEAGVRPGDRIVSVDGRPRDSRDRVIEALRGMFPGERVQLTIRRTEEGQSPRTIEIDATIREFRIMEESDVDRQVNGPRNERLSGFDQVIQHDTVIDPDQCGGPVLDTSGRVVGLNIARAGRVITYSLPSSLVQAEIIGMLEEARATATQTTSTGN